MQGVAFYNPFTVIINHRPTQRAPGKITPALRTRTPAKYAGAVVVGVCAFLGGFWAQTSAVKVALSRPAHERVPFP